MGGWYWFQWNQQKPERVALNGAPHFPAGDPPGGILNCRINPKLHPTHMALPTSLNSASGPGLPYFPTRQQSSHPYPHPHALTLGLRHWLFLCLEPPPRSSKDTSSRSLLKSHAPSGPAIPLSPQHISVLFFNQRWKSISYA